MKNLKRTIITTTTIAWGILSGCLAILSAQGADPASFTDGFEGSALDPFWVKEESNGAVTLTTTRFHSGSQGAQFSSTAGGQKTVFLSHNFERPQYGQISVWFYDQKNYIYFTLFARNGASGKELSLGVQDWDYSAYYFGANGTGGKSSVARTTAWHQFTMKSTVTEMTLAVDGQVVYTNGSGGFPCDKIILALTGPGSGGVCYDDFAFQAAPEPAAIQISALDKNGRLSWTNEASLSNGLFTVEWAPALGTNWQASWNRLQAFSPGGISNVVEVPMFYRVKCFTNLFVPWRVGGSLTFNVSNAVGNTWTEEMKILSVVKPTAGGGKEFALLENTRGGGLGLQLMRSSESSVYRLDANTLAENLEFMRAPAGTTWTNYNYEGQITLKVTVESIEAVTVGGFTFPGCYKFHKQALNAGDPEAHWYEWIMPGFGMVKWVDHWMDPSMHPPIVHELSAWSVQP